MEGLFMHRFHSLVVALLTLGLSAQCLAGGNLLSNEGFELPSSDTNSIGNWFRFGSGANGFALDSTTEPRTGSGHMSLNTVGAFQFAGVFQTLPVPVNPGDTITFTGWHKTTTPPYNATSEIKIEWQGAPQNRLDVLTLGTQYEMFMHSAVAPAGTTGAVVTYAISSFGAGQSGTMQVFIDDFSAVLTPVPEPAMAGILGISSLGLMRSRRR
jgi:hypothetical protein